MRLTYRSIGFLIFSAIALLIVIGKSTSTLKAAGLNETSASSTVERVTSTYKSITRPPEFVITSQDLTLAGFTKVEPVASTTDRFLPPVQYFRVGEKITPQAAQEDCEDCANLVSVYITPHFATSSPEWILTQNPVVSKIGGRVAYKWFIGYRILYIIGPRQDLIENLAKGLRERIVLNKVSL